MADQIGIQLSAEPWKPTDDTEMMYLLSKYDVPRAGILRQAGNPYLFAWVDEFKDISAWVYVLIEQADIDVLRRGPDQMIEHFERTKKPITVAMSVKGQGIVVSSILVRREGASFTDSAWQSLIHSIDALMEQEPDLNVAN